MTTVDPLSDGYFQPENSPCRKAQIVSNRFLEHDSEFIGLKCPPGSPDGAEDWHRGCAAEKSAATA